jgi:uncharacterized protein YcfJ
MEELFMKKTAIAVGALFTALAPAAFAQYQPDYRDGDNRDRTARVLESRPVYEYANGGQECWNPRAGHFEGVRPENHTRIGKGAAIGAVAGGVIGHQTDSNIGTGVGAVLGGIIGHQIERRNNENDQQDDLDYSRCRAIGGNNGNVVGYDVRYQVNGQEYVARMDHDPGRRVRLDEVDYRR